MTTKTKQWTTGTGSATIEYGGQGNGSITITSDANNLYETRSMQITIKTTSGSPQQTKTITINQAAKQRIDISSAVVTANNQTYNGSAKTPTPTVTLNGTTIPSSGYDVTYSNNTNAGTATITVTGKGDYTGTATGTFTIAKASRTLSFNSSYMVLNTSSNATKTATPSAGSGDGAITYSIANTTYATINSSTGKVTSKTSDGSATVTATISEGTNYLSASTSYILYVFATIHDYSYTGTVQTVALPPGLYKFQVWGAQGGSNGANSSYGISAQTGGKGGYSEGTLSLSSKTTLKVHVGGQGTASAGGYNGGGSTTETSQYDSDNIFGYSKMGGGGGATDIRLSNDSLYSRMIVAGGGSGSSMCYKRITIPGSTSTAVDGESSSYTSHAPGGYAHYLLEAIPCPAPGTQLSFDIGSNQTNETIIAFFDSESSARSVIPGYGGHLVAYNITGSSKITVPDGASYFNVLIYKKPQIDNPYVKVYHLVTTPDTYETSVSARDGYAGGGIDGVGYSTAYIGRPHTAGSGGSYGNGAAQSQSQHRYCSGAGGGGWYGGGSSYSDDNVNSLQLTGGGSGFVNISANASYRPSGYTGLQLDSGETKAGNTSFLSTSGGTETGHSGNGYARITRIS